MIGFLVLACHISFTNVSLQCDWEVRKTFKTVAECTTHENSYTLLKGEHIAMCDELKDGVKVGDTIQAVVIKK